MNIGKNSNIFIIFLSGDLIYINRGNIWEICFLYCILKIITVPENHQVTRDIKEKFSSSYTVNMDNYILSDEYVINPRAIKVQASCYMKNDSSIKI